jgi:hypothetical protein
LLEFVSRIPGRYKNSEVEWGRPAQPLRRITIEKKNSTFIREN